MELAYWMVVGNCGHSIGGHHGAGVNEIDPKVEREDFLLRY